MSCNKPNCCKKNNLPREEMNLDISAVAQAFTQMLQVAKTGINNFKWNSPELVQLAQMIVALVRKPEPVQPATPDASVNGDSLTLRFGPQNSYALHVPAGTEKQRHTLITQLLEAATKLSTPAKQPARTMNLNQLTFDFPE